MTLKTIKLPTWLAPYAARVHAFLSAAPAAEWSLTFPVHRSPGELSATCPTLTISPLPTAPDWLREMESATTTIHPASRLAQFLRGQAPLDLADGVQLQLQGSITAYQLTSSEIVAGRIPLPPLSVLIPNLPDPTAHSIEIVPRDRAFVLHLTGGLTRAAFTVRMEF
jgi:hypothetical protein